jgi:DNA-binding transcriptional MerR regulator
MDALSAYVDIRLSLEGFVSVVNRMLPEFLPEQKAKQRVREDVTPRLVRYYATLGMLDEPAREGREVRYLYRHLLQFLVVRKLLTKGHGATAIGNTARTRSNEELERLLIGGAQLSVAESSQSRAESQASDAKSNPALDFLSEIRSQKRSPIPQAAPSSASISSVQASQLWVHLEILPGLQILVRDDFLLPSTPSTHQALLELIAEQLVQLENFRRNNP